MKNILITLLFITIILQDVISRKVSLFSYVDEIIVSLMLISLITYFVVKKEMKKQTLYILIGISLFLVISIISSLYSSIDGKIIILGSILSIKFFVVILFFSEIKLNKITIILLIQLINITAIIAVIFAIIDLKFPIYLRELLGTFGRLDYRGPIVSVQSIFIHPGVYGWFMLFSSILNYAIYKSEKKKKNLILFFLFLIFSLFSLRFKVVLGILIILVFDTIKTKKNIIWKLVPSTILIAIVVYINKALILLTIDRYITASVYVSARKALYYFSNVIAQDYFPLGSGIGTFGSWYSRVNYSDLYYVYGLNRVQGMQPYFSDWITDTYWPSILAENGYIGLLVLILLHIYIMKNIIKKNMTSSIRYYPPYIYTTSLLLLFYSLVESAGEQIYNSAPQFIFIGTVVGLSLNSKMKEINNEKNIVD